MELDFETYSEAGFIWDEKTQKYKAPPNATKKGLPTIGAAVYSEHHSTEVLSCAYDLGDGIKKLWIPGMPPPFDLFEYLSKGGLLEAWNVKFERWIWINVCMRKYGWPAVQEWQWRDAAAKAVAHALPKSLDPCGMVMNITNKKDKDGWRLLTKFSMPRNPTKGNPNRRIYPKDDPEDAQRLYAYNVRDIEAELELSSLIPDLIPSELEFWQCDLAINARGIRVDVPAIKAAIAVIEQAHSRYNARLQELTGYTVTRASELAKIRVWLESQGVSVPVLDADKVTELLKADYLTDQVREVLEIRELLSSAAVKKLYAMLNMVTESERLHDLFIYHSARTGRAAGAGVQPQNFPNSGPDVNLCRCGRYSPASFNACTNCGNTQELKKEEWNAPAVNQAIQSISTASLDCVEYYHGNAIATVSGCLRGLFIPDSGKDFICSDYSAIEAVCAAALAGEEWRLEVFRTHGRIYEASASKITGRTLEYYLDHKKTTGVNHPDRKIGKVAELACFDKSTIVLTKRGEIPIIHVLETDELWDGIEWVKHQGVLYKGERQTLILDGVRLTPNHPVYLGNEDLWKPASSLYGQKLILLRALAIGSENLPWSDKNKKLKTIIKYRLNVIVEKGYTWLKHTKYYPERAYSVFTARLKQGIKLLLGTKTLYLAPCYAKGLCYGYKMQYHDAITQKTRSTLTTGVEVSTYVTNGGLEGAKELLLSTLSPFLVGMNRIWKWIESTLIEVTNPVISALLQNPKTCSIKEKSKNFKQKSKLLKPVYDIVNAGPRNRFTIRTNSGYLLVHNSGYGGWIGAWKAFGADSFMSDDEIKQAILAWRAASPAIVEVWGGQVRGWFPDMYGLEGAAVQAIMNPGQVFDCRGFEWQVREDILYCKLLSGRNLTYHRPLLRPSERKNGTYSLSFEGWNSNPKYGAPGWVRMDTYSGKIFENVCQAVARDILAHAIVNLERANYPVVLHVHDEIVSEVPENYGSIAEFEEIMSTMPDWAKGWPLKASGGWRAKRYGK